MSGSVLERIRLLARDCDIVVSISGYGRLSLDASGDRIFEGTLDECLLYLRGWSDGRDHYLRHESRGANE